MNQLPIFLNLQGHKVILLGDGPAADAKRRLYKRAGAVVTDDEQDPNALIAVVAIESDEEAMEVYKRLKARGLLVNVVDRSDLCDFTTPAIVDRDPVLIAIGTGGASAGLAKALRQRLEKLLPQSLGGLAVALGDAKAKIGEKFPDARDRRKAIDDALSESGPLDPVGEPDRFAIDHWLGGDVDQSSDELVEMVLTSVDPEELTLRQARLLGQADTIISGPDVPDAILHRARADAERIAGDVDMALSGLTIRLKIELDE